ncbi:MAG TPA: HD domain-containing protein [Rubrobacteraceae bacterium]|nr:HD domain-containing protein [Rubrobacteraceae bacterium]
MREALEPPLDEKEILEAVPELSLARGLGQGPFHHLDVFDHTLEVLRGVERELAAGRPGARVRGDRVEGLRLAALLHDVAKPVTRGEVDGRVLFVSHDSLGAAVVREVCRRLGLSAQLTDLAATLTALHLKIGFMRSDHSDYPPGRLARAAGPFGEELAVLSWADRLAAQGPRLERKHLERHRSLCAEFLTASRDLGPHPEPVYEKLVRQLGLTTGADGGYAASRLRLFEARGLGEEAALAHVARLLQAPGSGPSSC